MSIDKNYIAQVLQNARRKTGLKQAELAEKINISEKHLSKIETGKNFPALDTFFKIIEVLQLNLVDFGINIPIEESTKRKRLQNIITNASEKQIDFYTDIINAINKHI